MADYTIISDVSAYIVKMLREKMCPEPVPSPNNIEISSPASQDVDYIIGLYLYDVREETTIARPPTLATKGLRITKPPVPYSLYYMVFINGSSQMGLKAPDIQKIIGKAAQVVSDNSMVYPQELQPWLDVGEPPIMLCEAKMALDEKVRVWQAISKPYQISLFYKAAPVFVSSGLLIEPLRVREAAFGIDIIGHTENQRGGG